MTHLVVWGSGSAATVAGAIGCVPAFIAFITISVAVTIREVL